MLSDAQAQLLRRSIAASGKIVELPADGERFVDERVLKAGVGDDNVVYVIESLIEVSLC